ncbi:MAG: biotin operon repressor, partial [Gammaproteobacteria bacterium]
MSQTSHAIIRTLADGAFHSGEQLARALRISRSAVWKHVHQIKSQGLEVFSVPGRGYRLATPMQLLDEKQIRAGLAPANRKRLPALAILDQVDSTSTWLMTQPLQFPAVCLAEWQTAGRG